MGPRNHVLDGNPQVLRYVATATNSGIKIAITGFVRTTATIGNNFMELGLSGRPTDLRYFRYLAPKGTLPWQSFFGFLYI